jgi:hypothetical protein
MLSMHLCDMIYVGEVTDFWIAFLLKRRGYEMHYVSQNILYRRYSTFKIQHRASSFNGAGVQVVE